MRGLAHRLEPYYPHTRGKYRLRCLGADDFEYYTILMGGTTKEEKRNIFAPSFLRQFKDYDDYWLFRMHWKEDYDILSRLQYLDMKTYLPDDILTKVDIASMAVSLELRVPLLDHTLVEFVASLPWTIRNRNLQRKYLFRKSARGMLDERILNKRKQGFSIPLGSYFSISDVPLASSGFLKDILDIKRSVVSRNSTQIWQTIALYKSLERIEGPGRIPS